MATTGIEEHTVYERQILALAKGFNVLLELTQKLTCQERQLRERLQFAYLQYLQVTSQLSGPPKDRALSIADRIRHKGSFEYCNYTTISDIRSWVRGVEDSGYITDSGATAVVEGAEVYKSLAGQLGLDNGHQTSNHCQVAADAQVRTSMERDFTTNGVHGSLQCPFAKSDGNQSVVQVEDGKPETCANDDLDPIKAEFHSRRQSTASMSGRSAAAARCPIRYLDNHSPEELALYFERHKHEIPRSHAICIQRYQRNSQSLRQLDEKYGDFVTMVKDLGKYHQPYLSENQGDPGSRDPASVARVEKWAEDVSTKAPAMDATHLSTEGEESEGEDGRENHFDRSLRDVRVGESPSRPWGIHVPVSDPPVARSVARSPAIPVAADHVQSEWSRNHESPPNVVDTGATEQSQPAGPGRCPFHVPDEIPTDKNSSATETLKTPKPQSNHPVTTPPVPSSVRLETSHYRQPNAVFNGPVFFGYSPEAAALMLEKLGSINTQK
ncbi:hypothetical protein VTO42DRAFT_3698 [Malbranchea cinnamomea]